jgi:addiction module HigA family antidote
LQIERPRLERIVREEQGISANTALRLGKFFGTTPEFWMNLQTRYELERARRELGARLNKIKSHSEAAA